VRAWVGYAGVGLLATLVAGAVGAVVAGPAARGAVWLAAGAAYLLQVVAFAGLLAVRARGELFLAGWVGGMGLRVAALAVLSSWAARTGVVPRAPLLVAFVAFLFLLLLLEPLFLRRGLRTT
jgi:hypothetical protein